MKELKQSELEKLWYNSHNCTHAHCPNECEHPQPFLCLDGRMLCGRCSALSGIATEVVPCTPENCNE